MEPTTNPIFIELVNLTYFFAELIALGILISIIFTVDNYNNIKWTFAGGSSHFKKTSLFVIVVIIIAFLYYFVDRLVNEPIVGLLLTLDFMILPLSLASGSFFAFYLTKVGLNRSWQHPVTITTLIIFLITIGIFGYLFSNSNLLLEWQESIEKLEWEFLLLKVANY